MLTILSGVPGSGKSTWAQAQDAFVLSTDDYSLTPGDFALAHPKCYAAFLDVELSQVDVIVDNTNTTAWEIAPYYLAAQAARVEVKVLRITPKSFEDAYRRNVHGVPFDVFCTMVANFKKRDVMPWWVVEEL